jgi:hypothetical protein
VRLCHEMSTTANPGSSLTPGGSGLERAVSNHRIRSGRLASYGGWEKTDEEESGCEHKTHPIAAAKSKLSSIARLIGSNDIRLVSYEMVIPGRRLCEWNSHPATLVTA